MHERRQGVPSIRWSSHASPPRPSRRHSKDHSIRSRASGSTRSGQTGRRARTRSPACTLCFCALPLEQEAWSLFSSVGPGPDEEAEQSELLEALQRAIAEVLTQHQRRVLVALALNEVPIDVLAERLGTSRGALYKTLHDARRKLRKHMTDCGFRLQTWTEEPS